MPFGVRIGERALRRPIQAPAPPVASGIPVRSLGWIDDFFREAKSHIFAREEDGVVILPPNQVYKANPTGIAIVRHMCDGGKAASIPGIGQEERTRQVADFVADLRALYLGQPAASGRAPYESVPYTFQYTKLPILGEIAVTYRCNNACVFCYAECGTQEPGCGTREPGCGAQEPGCGIAPRAATPREVSGGREMSLAEIEQIIRVFKEEARIPFFSFTGGEPLLREDLEDMIRVACRSRLQINLITNGTLADRRRARSLFNAGLRTAQVSVESLDAETHDLLTARPGSFQKTMEGIRSLQAAGVSVQTNTTMTAVNLHDAPRMPAFLKSMGVTRFAMNLYVPVCAGQGSPDDGDGDKARAEALFIPYTRAGAIIESVRMAARAARMTFFWYSPIPHCHYNTIARGLGNKSCAAMDGLLSVSPAGDVLPCSSFPESMGNLLRVSFRDIWFSPRAGYFKNKHYAPAECAGCTSFTACQAACPLYWRYAGTSEIRNHTSIAQERSIWK
jgi:radical SAM protein with 4Fe4S-binding SPASM domain